MTRFSIITPVYNPPIWALKKCIESVLTQTYTDWEWRITDDCSTNPEVLKILQKLAKKDSRVHLQIRHSNGGIVEASNDCINSAQGEFVVLLDNDDVLSRDALSILNDEISIHPDVDYLYSDEAKLNSNHEVYETFRKPGFSPERLRGQNYCCHLSCIRTSLITEIGGFRKEFEGSQDYDLILRVTELARLVVHIPKVLYYWRNVEGSTSSGSEAKPYTIDSALRAVESHCQRIGIEANFSTLKYGYIEVKRKLQHFPKVSIIIPTRGDRKSIWGIETCLAANAIRSIFETSTYPNFDIVLVHDRVSQLDPELIPHTEDSRVKVVWYDKPFDFSDKCNVGVVESDGEIIVLLNDDTEIESPDWIETLVGFLNDSSVAMVGPLLRLEDGRVQSAGHSNNPAPQNYGSGESSDSGGMYGDRLISREVSGVTGACLAVSRARYFDLGGMSRVFPHSFNDVDFAFKALEYGYRIIWTPQARLWHFESLSRDPSVKQSEIENLESRWHRYFAKDIFTV